MRLLEPVIIVVGNQNNQNYMKIFFGGSCNACNLFCPRSDGLLGYTNR